MLGALLSVAVLAVAAPDATAPRATPGTIAFAFDPAAPVKGRDAAVTVRLDVRDAAGNALAPPAGPPRVAVSSGVLGPLRAGDAPGRWEARWEPSRAPQPEVAAFLALAPRCPRCPEPLAAGGARLPISAAVELPGRSEPGVSVTVEIAGRSWGPVTADADGRFLLPAVVPPGARWGLATSRSSLGNEKRTKLDLQLDDRPGLLCAAWPGKLPADGATEGGLACLGWTAEGRAIDAGSLRATADRGSVVAASGVGPAPGPPRREADPPGPEEEGRTVWLARYRPPAGGVAPDRIAVTGGPSRAPASASLTVELVPGPPASIEWKVEGEPALPGSSVPVRARVLDAFGSVVGEATAVDGSIVDGRLRIRPDYGDGRQRVTLRFTPSPGEDGAPAPAALSREVEVALRPPGTLDVTAWLEGGWLRWRVVGPDGAPLRGRRVSIDADGVELGPLEPDGEGGRCAVRRGRGTISVTDVPSGVSALLEVR